METQKLVHYLELFGNFSNCELTFAWFQKKELSIGEDFNLSLIQLTWYLILLQVQIAGEESKKNFGIVL